ncbi:hypothetical protein [Peribacillus frigoritolerans]|uniref:hypothetical protein n=1 Tax=Peribacillus frigoritolerans TaxID=450367 RepID=UPI00381E956A
MKNILSQIVVFALVISSFGAFASANEGSIQTDKAQVNTNGEDEVILTIGEDEVVFKDEKNILMNNENYEYFITEDADQNISTLTWYNEHGEIDSVYTYDLNTGEIKLEGEVVVLVDHSTEEVPPPPLDTPRYSTYTIGKNHGSGFWSTKLMDNGSYNVLSPTTAVVTAAIIYLFFRNTDNKNISKALILPIAAAIVLGVNSNKLTFYYTWYRFTDTKKKFYKNSVTIFSDSKRTKIKTKFIHYWGALK